MKRFELVRLPFYLIIMYKRFHKNQWFIEKNPTIVNFPIRLIYSFFIRVIQLNMISAKSFFFELMGI